MNNIVFTNKEKTFKKMYKIFINSEKGLIEPKKEVADYGRICDCSPEDTLFSIYETEELALEALFKESDLDIYKEDEFVVLPIYQIKPVY